MNQFLLSFNNREIAIVIWITVLLLFALKSGDVRSSTVSVLKAFFEWKISVLIACVGLFTVSATYILSKVNMWNSSLLKDTIFWFCGVGFLQLFKIIKAPDSTYYKKLAIEALKVTIFLEFIANLYVFNLGIEIPFILVIFMFSMMKPLADREKKYSDVSKLINTTIPILSGVAVIFSIYKSIVQYDQFFSAGNFKALALSPILTLCYLPLLYCIALSSAYETFFIRLTFYSNDKQLVSNLKKATWQVARFNINKLNNISRNLVKYDVYNATDIRSYIARISKSNTAS